MPPLPSKEEPAAPKPEGEEGDEVAAILEDGDGEDLDDDEPEAEVRSSCSTSTAPHRINPHWS